MTMTTGGRIFEWLYLATPFLVLVFVARGAWRRLFTAEFRADLFTLRRRLFCVKIDERLTTPAAVEAYGRLRQTLNGMLYEADKLTWLHLVVAITWVKTREEEPFIENPTFEAINKVENQDLRGELQWIHKHTRRAVAAHLLRLVWVTPPMYPLVFWVNMRWLPRRLYELIAFLSNRDETASARAAA